jgi:hypothetical protein
MVDLPSSKRVLGLVPERKPDGTVTLQDSLAIARRTRKLVRRTTENNPGNPRDAVLRLPVPRWHSNKFDTGSPSICRGFQNRKKKR